MTKEERDKRIVEELGGEPKILPGFCDELIILTQKIGIPLLNIDLSTHSGFFWVWNRAKEKEWWKEFINAKSYSNSWNLVKLIHPDYFADALAEFLVHRKDESLIHPDRFSDPPKDSVLAPAPMSEIMR